MRDRVTLFKSNKTLVTPLVTLVLNVHYNSINYSIFAV